MAIAQTNDLLNAAQDFGGAVTSLFGGRGASASAGSFEQAAGIAEQNAQLTKQATAIKQTQNSRQIFKTLGAQTAAIGGAGFSKSGTSLDLMRESASQGALTKALTAEQGAITENSYAEQAGMYQGMAGSAKSSSTAQTVGGVLQGAGGLYNLYNGTKGLFNGTTQATADLAPWLVSGGSAAADLGGGLAGAGFGADILGSAGTIAATGADIASTALVAEEAFSLWDVAAFAFAF